LEILHRYPGLQSTFDRLCQTRRDEILAHLTASDSQYDSLRRNRADASMALLGALSDDALLEAYSDAVYAQESYELDAVYRLALYDALDALNHRGIL
jgi:hypothetical protein